MNVAELIRNALAEGKTRFAFELLPPLKGDGADGLWAAIDSLVEFDPAYINVTAHREAIERTLRPDGSEERRAVRRRPGTVSVSAAIKARYGVETVPHLICGGHSKYDIEDALIDMDFLGLHNVLALRGDKSQNERRFAPHPQGHARAADLVRQIAAMNRGRFVDGQVEVRRRPTFSIGVAGYPECHVEALSPQADIAALKAKVDAGAEYIVTQLFYDNARFFDFVRRCRAAGIGVPIVPGIKPLATLRHLTLLPETFGCSIPEPLRREALAHRDDKAALRRIGTEWAIAQSRELKAAGVPVLHFYPMGRAENIVEIARTLF